MNQESNLQKAWKEFIITVGKELKFDKFLDWLSRIINKHNKKEYKAIIKFENGSEIKISKDDNSETIRSKGFGYYLNEQGEWIKFR